MVISQLIWLTILERQMSKKLLLVACKMSYVLFLFLLLTLSKAYTNTEEYKFEPDFQTC